MLQIRLVRLSETAGVARPTLRISRSRTSRRCGADGMRKRETISSRALREGSDQEGAGQEKDRNGRSRWTSIPGLVQAAGDNILSTGHGAGIHHFRNQRRSVHRYHGKRTGGRIGRMRATAQGGDRIRFGLIGAARQHRAFGLFRTTRMVRTKSRHQAVRSTSPPNRSRKDESGHQEPNEKMILAQNLKSQTKRYPSFSSLSN